MTPEGLFIVLDVCFNLLCNIHFEVSHKYRRVFLDIIGDYVEDRGFGLFEGDFVRLFVELTIAFEFINIGLIGCLQAREDGVLEEAEVLLSFLVVGGCFDLGDFVFDEEGDESSQDAEKGHDADVEDFGDQFGVEFHGYASVLVIPVVVFEVCDRGPFDRCIGNWNCCN